MIAQRTERLMVVTGVVSVCCGVYNAWSTYAAIATVASRYANGIAQADTPVAAAQTTTLGLAHQLALPRLLLTEPLIWIGLLLILAPAVLRRLGSDRRPAGSAAYVGYAYVECPHCHQPARASDTRCPSCGEPLTGVWGTEAGAPYLRRDPARR